MLQGRYDGGWPESWDWAIDERVAGALGSVGGFAALFLFLAPLPTFKRIWQEKTTSRFSGLPYAFALVQCELWGLYSLLTPHMTAPLVTNAIGITLEAAYVLIFIAFAGQARREVATLVLFLSSGVAAFCWIALRSYGVGPDATKAIGMLAVFFNVVMYAAPLSVMGEVVRTRSVDCMPLRLTVASCLCPGIWIVFGIYVRNSFVLFPNVLGFALGLAQLVLYGVYARSSPGAQGAHPRGGDVGSAGDLRERLVARSLRGAAYGDQGMAADARAPLLGGHAEEDSEGVLTAELESVTVSSPAPRLPPQPLAAAPAERLRAAAPQEHRRPAEAAPPAPPVAAAAPAPAPAPAPAQLPAAAPRVPPPAPRSPVATPELRVLEERASGAAAPPPPPPPAPETCVDAAATVDVDAAANDALRSGEPEEAQEEEEGEAAPLLAAAEGADAGPSSLASAAAVAAAALAPGSGAGADGAAAAAAAKKQAGPAPGASGGGKKKKKGGGRR